MTNLQEQLSKGYNFFDMITHGYITKWSLDGERYHEYDAKELNNKGFTIITTTACQTNQFDDGKYDPCLSEAFIRNVNSGIVAYLGSSRFGIDSQGKYLGPSSQYEAQFYKYLFSDVIENKNFGTIVALAKASMISNCLDNNNYR